MKNNAIVYLGFNNLLKHKRGVENVILFQSEAIGNIEKYYLFFDDNDVEFQYKNLKCIGIRRDIFRFIRLNIIISKIKKTNNLIVHSHNYLMSFFLINKTDIFTVHDGLYYLSSKRRHKLSILFRIIEKMVYFRAKKIHFISEFSKKESLYNKKLAKDFIIMNSTPLENLKKENYKKHDEVEEKRNILFTVRSIEERARIDLLIQAAEKMKDKIFIEIAGKGPLLEKFKLEIIEKGLNNIVLYGFLSDEEIVSKYLNCNGVILPAEFGEGFGLPIIEGYLFNKPVIASNKCAIPEIIIDKEYLFENNIENICEKIQKIIDNKYPKYNFKAYYLERFSLEKILEKYRDIYKQISGEKQ